MRPRLQKMKRNYVHMKHAFLSCDFPWGEMNKHLPTSVSVWEHRWPTPAGAGAQYCCTPEAPCLPTTQPAECPPSGLASFDCFQKGIFPVFFIINSETVRQLWKSSHSAHRWHTTFLELKHTTTSWRMNLSVAIHSCQSLQKSFQPAAGQS